MLKGVLQHFSQNKFLFFCCLAFIIAGIIARFLWLDTFPPGITHDEADFVLSARTLWSRGVDVSGTPFPAFLVKTLNESGQTGLGYFLASPFIGIFGTGLSEVRILFVLINIASGVILAYLVWDLTRERNLSLLTLAIFLINPWSFAFSRSLLEVPLSLLFLLLGVYFLFKKNTKFPFRPIIFFTISFFSYLGTMVSTLLSSFLLIFFKNFQSKRNRFFNIFLPIFILLSIFSSYFLISRLVPGSTIQRRIGEVTLLNTDQFSSTVDFQRRTSLEFPGKDIFFNKITALGKQLISKYSGAFSIEYLFISGDPRATYRFVEHGLLYSIDLLFIFMGFLGLYKYGRQLFGVVVILGLISPLGSSLSNVENSYFYRSSFLIPVFVVLISFGIFFVYKEILSSFRNPFLFLITLAYIAFFANFIVFYFFRYPILQQENYYLGERVFVNYLTLADRGEEKIWSVVMSPAQIFKEYLIFSKDIPQPFPAVVLQKDYSFGNFVISNKCPTEDFTGTVITQAGIGIKCPNFENRDFLVIQNQKDTGTIFKIYNDRLCSKETLTLWRRYHKIDDYNIESMSIGTFCQRWINTSLH